MNEYFFIVDGCKIGPVVMGDLPLNITREIRKEFAYNIGLSWADIQLTRDNNGNNL